MLNIEILEVLGTEPVTLAEAKEYCRIDNDYTGEDLLLEDLIKSSRIALENFANISIIEKRIKVFSDTDKTLWLPFSPVIDVESITNNSGDPIEFDASIKYKLKLGQAGPYYITYTAGFITIPQDIKLAVLKQVLTDYDNRENFTVNNNSTVRSSSSLSNSAKNLIHPYSRNLFL